MVEILLIEKNIFKKGPLKDIIKEIPLKILENIKKEITLKINLVSIFNVGTVRISIELKILSFPDFFFVTIINGTIHFTFTFVLGTLN